MVMGKGDMRFLLSAVELLAQGCRGWAVGMVGQAGLSLSRRQIYDGTARGG